MRVRSPFWILCGVFLFSGLLFGVGSLVWLPTNSSRLFGVRLVLAVASGVAFGVASVVFIRLSWRWHGGRAAVQERTRAVERGVLPESADATWLPGLRARRQNAQQLKWLLPSLALLMVVLGIAHLRDTALLGSLYWFALAVPLALLGIRWIRRGPRDVVVLDGFIEALEQQHD